MKNMKTVWELSPQGLPVKKVQMSDSQWRRVQQSKLAHRFREHVQTQSKSSKKEGSRTTISKGKPKKS